MFVCPKETGVTTPIVDIIPTVVLCTLQEREEPDPPVTFRAYVMGVPKNYNSL